MNTQELDLVPEVYFASSDMYQLLGNFLFLTTPELACALADGSLAHDVASILSDSGFPESQAAKHAEAFGALVIEPASEARQEGGEGLVGGDARIDELFHAVRRDYTHLFYNAKVGVMTPYEARFLKEETGLFEPRGALPKGVAGLYAQAGFESRINPKERADHMGIQLEFLQMLRASQGEVLAKGDHEKFAAACQTAQDFSARYFAAWAEDFFEEVARQALMPAYRALGELGAAFVTFDRRLDLA